MPRQVVEYRVLIISPGAMAAARESVRTAIADWNAHVGVSKGVRLEAVGWESHAHPGTGEGPQDVINKQVGDSCDIGVALFGARMGSRTATAASGSAEEIERLLGRNAPVMIYTSTEPIKLEGVDIAQATALRAYLELMKKRALLGAFSNPDELRRQLSLHLTKVVEGFVDEREASLPDTLTASVPDVRVSVAVGMPMPEPPDPKLKAVLSISIQNHSPVPFYFSQYYFELENGNTAMPMSDAVTLRPVMAQTVPSGDSITFTVSFLSLMEQLREKKTKVVGVVAVDKIGRKFFSSKESIAIALKNAAVVLRSK